MAQAGVAMAAAAEAGGVGPNLPQCRAAKVTLALEPVGDTSALEALWRTFDFSGAHSFFASWTWAAALLRHAPNGLHVLKAARGGALAGLALCSVRGHWPLRRAWFNASGNRAFDGVMIEHNGFAVPGEEDGALWTALFAWFAAGGLGVGELFVPGTAVRAAVPPELIVHEQWRQAYRTPLANLGADGIAPILSRNARQQLRRSLRDVGGKCTIEAAKDPATALMWFAQLKALHVRSWTRRGCANAFDNPAFEPFHRTVIASGVADGTVDMLRIAVGKRALGYLYNFKRNGIAYSYQSGFCDDDQDVRPGYVCHALAIGHYAAQGLTAYDFLAGTNRLKQSYGIETYELGWRRLRRPVAAFCLDRLLRRSGGNP